MKTIYKTLVLGVFMTALLAVTPAFAQGDCSDLETANAIYQKYLDNYKGVIDKTTVEQRRLAVAAAKEYVDKYAACETFKDTYDYLKKKGPELSAKIDAALLEIDKQERYTRFDKAMKAGNASEIFASGDDILKFEPNFLDVYITLAGVGLDETWVKQNNTYNAKTSEYAKTALKKIEAGEKSAKFGLYQYEYDSKENTSGWMTFAIGYIDYFRNNNKTAGLNNLYKSTQMKSETRDQEFIYELVGDQYSEKANTLNAEILELIKANNGQETFESKTKLALSKGYAERAIDAYSRAYDVAKSNLKKITKAELKATKETYVADLFETLKLLYKFRYETIEVPIADADLVNRLNTHIASVTKGNFPSPTTEVEPVDPPKPDEETTETETSTSSGTTSTTVEKPKSMPAPPAAKSDVTKVTTSGTNVKSDADRSSIKPKQR